MPSIRSTLTLWYTVALTVTVLAFGVTISVLERQANIADLDRQLRGQIQLVEGLLAAEYRADPRMVEESHDPMFSMLRLGIVERLEPVTGYLIVVDSAAHAVYGSAEVRRLTPSAGDSLRSRVFAIAPPRGEDQTVFTIELDHTPVRFVAVRVRSAGPSIVAVAAGTATRDVDLAPARLAKSMFVVSPLIILSALAVGWLLSSRALRPVRGMIDELEAITDGRSLHRRLPAGGEQPDELGRLANALNALLARLEGSFAALRRFVADASHELKTPLMVMRAGVERALTEPGTEPTALVPLEETLQEIRRTTELVDTLLTLARVDEGRMELHREPVDLRGVFEEAFETAQILGEDAGVNVRTELPEGPVMIDADRGRLRQLLMNLTENAVKYTPAGGEVAMSLTTTPTAVTISIKDTGIGIAPGDVARVFDRFWRADQARSRTGDRPGIGLGLSICKWIAEAHGGSIGLTSRPGRGSTFTVTLPRPEAAAPVVIES
jgi:two-component system, OmpR family, sensor kinase